MFPFKTVQKALAGLRRINLDGLRWRVFDAKGQVRILLLISIARMNSSEKRLCGVLICICDRCLDGWHHKLLLCFKARISQPMHHM